MIALWQACGLTRPWNDPAADIALARREPNSTVLIGRDGDAIVATAMVGHDGHRGWVYYVATDPDRRAKGYGRAIMNAAEDWLRAAGIAKLQLMVRRENARRGRVLPIDRLRRSADDCFRQMARRPRADAVTAERNSMTISDRVRVKNIEILSDRHYLLNEVDVRLSPRQRRMADANARSLRPRSCRDAVAVQCRTAAPWC